MSSPHSMLTAKKDARKQPLGDVSAAAIHMMQAYDRARAMSFEDGMSELFGLFHAVRHNPDFKAELRALQQLIEGETVLNKFAAKVSHG